MKTTVITAVIVLTIMCIIEHVHSFVMPMTSWLQGGRMIKKERVMSNHHQQRRILMSSTDENNNDNINELPVTDIPDTKEEDKTERVTSPAEQESEAEMLQRLQKYLEPSKQKIKENLKKEAHNEVDKVLTEQNRAHGHEIHREYPFSHLTLPMLRELNSYYSGSFKGRFWHQNADQVFAFIPVIEKIKQTQVKVEFDAKSARVVVMGEEIMKLDFFDNIIPDGCFWMFETDQFGMKYILLDLEKRYRMVNWNSLLAGIVDRDSISRAVLTEQMLQTQTLDGAEMFGEGEGDLNDSEEFDDDADSTNGSTGLGSISDYQVLDQEQIENLRFENPNGEEVVESISDVEDSNIADATNGSEIVESIGDVEVSNIADVTNVSSE